MSKSEELKKIVTREKIPDKARADIQKAKGKLLARERIDILLDEKSFEEIDLLVKTRTTDFGLDSKHLPGDGVVTGFGRIDGRRVCIFSQDFTVMGGTLGLMHAQKVCKVMDLAMKVRVPVIGLCDSGGARIQEGVDALGGYAEIFYRNVQASGCIPQISAILGPCAGGAVYSPAITDFIFMVEGTSHMFITGPEVIRKATGEDTDFDSLGGARTHAEKSGVAQIVSNSEHDCFRQIRELLSFLPSSCFETPPAVATKDSPTRTSATLGKLSDSNTKMPYRVQVVIGEIADDHKFFEIHKDYAPNLVVGFIHLNGQCLGVVANNPQYLSGALDNRASCKGARFIRFCDAFNIPLLTLVDVPGYWPGVEQEHGGIIRNGAKLLYSFAEATVPRVTVILHKAYGGAYDVMSSKHIRGDFNFAWPCAEIAVMGPAGAVEILYSRDIKSAKDPDKFRDEKVAEYIRTFVSPYTAASHGYLDDVILAGDTRPKLIKAFAFLEGKKVDRPSKKHGNIPL